MPHTQQPRGPRGVYLRYCLSSRGYPLLEAVDSRNWKIFEREIHPGEDQAAVEDWLWSWLDARDPIPLRVVNQ